MIWINKPAQPRLQMRLNFPKDQNFQAAIGQSEHVAASYGLRPLKQANHSPTRGRCIAILACPAMAGIAV
ncbi:hypothetical protein [Pseudomonas sp. PIC25]|uniref:hypothetical protein n=1 Tax=Pseudomonas sp. PIC25 TaxID=1958773 RepID=UPI00117A4276|nr:hypothetical protein [Pseudomonas sp. PIC25]